MTFCLPRTGLWLLQVINVFTVSEMYITLTSRTLIINTLHFTDPQLNKLIYQAIAPNISDNWTRNFVLVQVTVNTPLVQVKLLRVTDNLYTETHICTRTLVSVNASLESCPVSLYFQVPPTFPCLLSLEGLLDKKYKTS